MVCSPGEEDFSLPLSRGAGVRPEDAVEGAARAEEEAAAAGTGDGCLWEGGADSMGVVPRRRDDRRPEDEDEDEDWTLAADGAVPWAELGSERRGEVQVRDGEDADPARRELLRVPLLLRAMLLLRVRGRSLATRLSVASPAVCAD